jgi:hypothetical protein
MELEKQNKSYAPTESMKNNARRGLALREKYSRGGLDASQAKSEGVGSGVARARDIINGNLSLQTVKRMYAFFERHEKNYDPKKRMPDGGPTAGTVAWLLWGGSSARAWARSILKKEGIVKSYTQEITESELETEDFISYEDLKIKKSYDEEKRIATFLVLEPQDDDGMTSDLHLDWYVAETVEKACRSFNKMCMKANLFHRIPTTAYSFVESYITPVEFILGDKFIKKGAWLATIEVEESEVGNMVWEGIKSGKFNGLSIQAMGSVEYIDED